MADQQDPQVPHLVSRRALLRAGVSAVAAAGAVGLTQGQARAADAVTVGAPGDTDASALLQEAVDRQADAGGGVVQLDAGTYYLAVTLQMRANVTLAGVGIGQTILRDADDLGPNALIEAIGTAGASLPNVTLRDLTIRNGTASTGAFVRGTQPMEGTPGLKIGKEGLVVNYTSGVTLRRVQITEIAGAAGFRVLHSSEIMVDNCHFYRCTYAMMAVDPDNDHITVQDSVFDTLTSRAYPNTYTFATIKRKGKAYPRYILIQRNRFVNNPLWEGIDSHGARDLTIRDNHVENCRTGVMTASVHGWVDDPDISNTVIENNTLIQGAALNLPGGQGIVRNSHGAPSRGLRIVGNRIVGYNGGTELAGTIEIYDRADDTLIEGNDIDQYGINAIALYYGTSGATIRGNIIRDVGIRKAGTYAAAIAASGPGNYGITVTGNTLAPRSPDGAPDYFVYSATGNQSWQIADNQIGLVRQASPYGGVARLPVDKDRRADLDQLQQAGGDVIMDSDGRPAWRVVWPRTGYGAVRPGGPIVTVAMAAGSPVAQIVAKAAGSWMELPPGMNVVVAGAGSGGSDLFARVIDNSATSSVPLTDVRITLDAAAMTTVANAEVTMQSLRVVPVRS